MKRNVNYYTVHLGTDLGINRCEVQLLVSLSQREQKMYYACSLLEARVKI